MGSSRNHSGGKIMEIGYRWPMDQGLDLVSVMIKMRHKDQFLSPPTTLTRVQFTICIHPLIIEQPRKGYRVENYHRVHSWRWRRRGILILRQQGNISVKWVLIKWPINLSYNGGMRRSRDWRRDWNSLRRLKSNRRMLIWIICGSFIRR